MSEFKGWTINAKVTLPGNITIGSELSGENWNPLTWKFSQDASIKYKNHTYKYGWFYDKKESGLILKWEATANICRFHCQMERK